MRIIINDKTTKEEAKKGINEIIFKKEMII
jgi:hypothetical protein